MSSNFHEQPHLNWNLWTIRCLLDQLHGVYMALPFSSSLCFFFTTKPQYLKVFFPSHPTHYSYNQFQCQHIDVGFRFRVSNWCTDMTHVISKFRLSLSCTSTLNTVVFFNKGEKGMWCSSCHTFAPIDSTFRTHGIYIWVSGGLREAHNWSQPTMREGPTPL